MPSEALLETPRNTSSSAENGSPAKKTYSVIRRNGNLAEYDDDKIRRALLKAFLAVEGSAAADSARIHETVEKLAHQASHALTRRLPKGGTLHIEDIQDQVELALMRNGHHKIARAYVLYREKHAQERIVEEAAHPEIKAAQQVHIISPSGAKKPFVIGDVEVILQQACEGLEAVSVERILEELRRSVFDGMQSTELESALVLSARTLIDQEPNYSFVSARLLKHQLWNEARWLLSEQEADVTAANEKAVYAEYFQQCIQFGVQNELLDAELARYDLKKLGEALLPERDLQFNYLGLQTLYDRYFLHKEGKRFELPQAFFMRVAMGLAINEVDREKWALKFYKLLSSFDFMSSTPTLFNSGTIRPQLSSCYLTTVPDDLEGIYNAIKDNALLSKYAGGLGNDWTPVRGSGAHIKGTNGQSQGIVPFLKVSNDTAVAVNQGGKRKGAFCAYLEVWHVDIEDFLDLRKNTGDDRRRTHDMNTANWIPDVFMQRVMDDGQWTLFSPNEAKDLHDLTGKAFAKAYVAYEQKADRGEMKSWKRMPAKQLWRKMLGQLFETGHPWITFKDPCNIRYTNNHVGVVHSSNLCTEITLHTSQEEIAVCNLGSVNLVNHVTEKGLDSDKLERTISVAMRMLDNVIDYNYYAVRQARNSNARHRPVGLGTMGFQDALHKMNIAYASEAAVEFADRSMEVVSYHAIKASTDLAEERGRYSTFEGSLWSRGILPIDSVDLLAEERGDYYDVDRSTSLDWSSLRERVKTVGMRNSNCLAIAPTATISNICGVSASIEPTYQNLYVKSNLSGEFTVVNAALIRELKEQGLWDEVMVNDLKYFDGCLGRIQRIPEALKQKYATAFEMDPRWLVEAGSRRQKWIDQAQSLNLYVAEPSGPVLDRLYKMAWVKGLKTTYYLRSLGATHVEKNVETQSVETAPEQSNGHAAPKACSITDPDCEACQ